MSIAAEFDISSLTEAPASGLTVVTATVTASTADVAVASFGANTNGSLPITEFYPNRVWEVGARYHLLNLNNGARPTLSAAKPELISMLLDGLAPEVRDGRVRVMGVVRQVGIRSKIAVAATTTGVDPIAACVGPSAGRVKRLSEMLLGERVDVVAWNDDPQTFIRNAVGTSVRSVDIDGPRAVVTVPAHQYQAAVGGGGLNAALASRLTGFVLSVVAG
jgi:transcription termination/antitermination protein NusA